ncbi:phage tail protein [Siccibacter turicensis]|uniref:Phage tail protein n=1 Tax=Siccibacter turicensis TaxID=357233 RepID=A0A2P8VGR8_9ENTR|nr:phage tail protein [Siccibacter turicensis]PSN06749.1 phage tail protein [Siccibacter turicensis]
MMFALGMFVFMPRTLPLQSAQRTVAYRWPSGSRVGNRAAYQYLGPDTDTLVLTGALYPELTGSTLSLAALRLMAEQGRAWPLIDGSGFIYGLYVIDKVTETGSELMSNGSARKTDFTVSLTRVDPPLTALLGDITQQAGELLAKAKGAIAGIAGGA